MSSSAWAQESLAAPTSERTLPDWKDIVNSKTGIYTGLVLAGIIACFWPFAHKLVDYYWFNTEGYYSHGILVPFIAAYIAFTMRDRLIDIPFKPQYWALIPLAGALYCSWVGTITDQDSILSVLFIGSLMLSVLLIGGWRWLAGLFLPVGYLVFAMPMWDSFIDAYTNPLQLISTKAAFQILAILGLRPMNLDSTTIALPNFTMNVGVPCSGLKLLLSVIAFMAFFMLIARLNWWKNLLLVVCVLPLCVFVNGLRIALIGIVGNQWGREAGMWFHDHAAGLISLLVCFLILNKLTRALGWK